MKYKNLYLKTINQLFRQKYRNKCFSSNFFFNSYLKSRKFFLLNLKGSKYKLSNGNNNIYLKKKVLDVKKFLKYVFLKKKIINKKILKALLIKYEINLSLKKKYNFHLKKISEEKCDYETYILLSYIAARYNLFENNLKKLNFLLKINDHLIIEYKKNIHSNLINLLFLSINTELKIIKKYL
tara:strand:+ start:599 stop:1144 length:546 start_codon:yes stop_codon:yes gene_type:complete